MEIVSPEGDVITVAYEFVDKKRASDLLDMNLLNRPLATRTGEQYGRAMENGDWIFTGDPIQLSQDRMLNGQHRAVGIEDSEVGQWLLVISGLPTTAQQYMDIGRRRSAVDMLSLQGVEKPRVLAATAHLLVSWEFWRANHSAVTPGVHEVTEYALANQDKIRAAWEVAAAIARTVNGGVSVPAIAAAYYRATQVTDAFTVAHFFDRIASNSNLRKGEPAHALITRFINLEVGDKIRDLWLTVRAWNAEMMGEALRLTLPKDGISSVQMPDMIPPKAEDVSVEREAALRALEELDARREQQEELDLVNDEELEQ
jgi:hypothetical protein